MQTVVSYPSRGQYGSSAYRGNCSGELVKELLMHYKPKRVLDPMAGSGTSGDVCVELGIDHLLLDLNPKYGGWDAVVDDVPYGSDFVFWHPPYHNIISYSGSMWGEPDERDLSRQPTYASFIEKMNAVVAKLMSSIRKGGRLAVLVGDVKSKGVLYPIQKDIAWVGTPEQMIIKMQHNCVSDGTSYASNFIKIVHEYLIVLRKDDSWELPVRVIKMGNTDFRNRSKMTWRDIVQSAIEFLGGKATLVQIYSIIEHHARSKTNQFWKEKVRQTLQLHPREFNSVERGQWSLV